MKSKRLLAGALVIMVGVGFLSQASAPVYAGGIEMPAVEEKTAEPAQTLKMPDFEYEESVMRDDEQPVSAGREKTWVWVLLGFIGAVFLTSL